MTEIIKYLKKEDSLFRKRLLITGYLTEQLSSQGIKPIVVGGHAVEVYTFQDYTTQDLDLVVANREATGEILEKLGFQRIGGARHWIHEDLELAIEIPDDSLAGDLERLLELDVDQYKVFIIGVEDLLIDRLNAYVHWKSISDYEQALKIYVTHKEEVDEDYLKRQAIDNRVSTGLAHLHSDYQDFTNRP